MPHESVSFGNFQRNQSLVVGESNSKYELVETDILDSELTNSHLDALKSMVLLVVREIEALKQILQSQLPHRKPGDRIDLSAAVL